MRVDTQAPSTRTRSAEQPTLARAAREFESLLTQRLVSQLRAKPEGEEGPGGGMMDLMVNQALAGHLAKGRGLGIAGVLYRSWTGDELPGSAVRLAGNAAGAPSMGGGFGGAGAPDGLPTTPYSPPAAPYSPDGGADDGVTPLRLMMPPTGLEGASLDTHSAKESPTVAQAERLGGSPKKDSLDFSLNGLPYGPEHSAGVPQHPFGSTNAAVRGVDNGHPTIDHTGPGDGRHSAEAGGGSVQRGRGLHEYRRSGSVNRGSRTSA